MNYLVNFLKKLKWRLFTAQTKKEKILFDFLYSFIFFGRFFRNKKVESKDNLFIWDVRNNSITFDIVNTLLQSSIRFEKRNNKKFDVLIYAPRRFKLRVPNYEKYQNYITSSDLSLRIENLIIPIIKSHNSVEEVFYSEDLIKTKNIIKKYKNTLPKIYIPKFYSPNPDDIFELNRLLLNLSSKNLFVSNKALLDSKDIKSFKSNRIKKERYVTFTIRDYGFSKCRNTFKDDIDKFLEFASAIKAQPIIVPDNLSLIKKYSSFEDKCIIYPEARVNIKDRIYLYKKSLVNIFTASGPGQLSLNIVSSKTIFIKYGSGGFDGNLKYYKELGLRKFAQPYLPLSGYIIWDGDSTYTSNDLLDAFSKIQEYRKNKN